MFEKAPAFHSPWMFVDLTFVAMLSTENFIC